MNAPPRRIRWRLLGTGLLPAVTFVLVGLVVSTFGGAAVVSQFVMLGVFLIAAMGLDLMAGVTGRLALSHVGFFATGGYVSSVLSTSGIDPALSLVAGVVLSLPIAYLIASIVVGLTGLYIAVATLAFHLMTLGLVSAFADLTGGAGGLYGIPAFSAFGVAISRPAFNVLVWVLAAVTVLLLRRVVGSATGRALRVIHHDPLVGETVGINTRRHLVHALAWSSAIGALAGGVYAHWVRFISPAQLGIDLLLEFLLAVFLGGAGTIWGAVFGVGVIRFIPEFGLHQIPEYSLVVFGVVFIVILMFMPRGIAGLFSAIAQRVHPRGAQPTGVVLAEAVRGGAQESPEEGALPHRGDEATRDVAERISVGWPEPMPIEAENLTIRFGGVVALDSVSVALGQRGITAVIGPNGAGKSTLLNSLHGVLTPTVGRVTIDGEDGAGIRVHERARRGLSRAFQTPTLIPSLTVLENVMLGAARQVQGTRRMGRTFLSAAAVEDELAAAGQAQGALESLGLADLATCGVDELSVGQQRMVEMARCIVGRPRTLLLDEPMAGLNGPERDMIGEAMRDLATTGMAVVWVEHDVERVLRIADRVVVLNFGRVIADAAPEEIRQLPEVRRAYLGGEPEVEEGVLGDQEPGSRG